MEPLRVGNRRPGVLQRETAVLHPLPPRFGPWQPSRAPHPPFDSTAPGFRRRRVCRPSPGWNPSRPTAFPLRPLRGVQRDPPTASSYTRARRALPSWVGKSQDCSHRATGAESRTPPDSTQTSVRPATAPPKSRAVRVSWAMSAAMGSTTASAQAPDHMATTRRNGSIRVRERAGRIVMMFQAI